MWKMKRMQLVFSLIWMHILLHLKREIKKGKKEKRTHPGYGRESFLPVFLPFCITLSSMYSMHHFKGKIYVSGEKVEKKR